MAKKQRDSLGDRMKNSYENCYRLFVPRRTYTIIRVDGRAFHTWTKGLKKPYDEDFMNCMDKAAVALCLDLCARFAYVQSDEISVLLNDFEDITTEAMFDGNLQKLCSISASIATAAFNGEVVSYAYGGIDGHKSISKKAPNATFDSRVFVIPDPVEVENYFKWRQLDAAKNSVNLLASAYASHKQLQDKDMAERHEIIHAAGDNWANHSVRFKHGAIIRRATAEDVKQWSRLSEGNWFVDPETPAFNKHPKFLTKMVPRQWETD